MMLEKQAGDDPLRTILLYKADFNFNNKIIGKQMRREAKAHGVIAKEQCGSRKRKRAVTCALNERLTFDILCQTKRPAGICLCNLKSYYDRILHSFAALNI